MALFKKNDKGELELDELGKLILGLILFVVLLGIVFYINGQFSGQGSKIHDAFNFLK